MTRKEALQTLLMGSMDSPFVSQALDSRFRHTDTKEPCAKCYIKEPNASEYWMAIIFMSSTGQPHYWKWNRKPGERAKTVYLGTEWDGTIQCADDADWYVTSWNVKASPCDIGEWVLKELR